MSARGVVEALDVVEHIRTGLLPRPVDFPGCALRLERAEEALHGRVVPHLARTAHAASDTLLFEQLLEVGAGVLGGFNRSSQHLQPGGVYGKTSRMDEAIDRKGRNALSGSPFASARG